MDRPSNYIPIDRRQLLALGQKLPERLEGAALFADISGFTPLTEALALELGPKRGAEELTVHLNRVYDALIAELHRFGGSVIGFSGDAITCWLDGDDGRRATAAALAMQTAMNQFAEVRTFSSQAVSLGMKAAVATGPVRRFVVGDPAYCRIDVMAGTTLERLAAAEHQAGRGEVILDEVTAKRLEEALTIVAWRRTPEIGQLFAVVTDLDLEVPETRWPDLPDAALREEEKCGWLLPPVYERLRHGWGEFLAELRPAYALFLRFSGIDYDKDPDAPGKLDAFIRRTQQILARFDGSLIQLTIGEKGSYMYIAFGAPIAHEDDAIRIAYTALELQDLAASLPYLEPAQIGIATGRMRTGAYGSVTRRTYGVLGDAVNLSARLMSAAKPGQILVSDAAKKATGDRFSWEDLPNIRVKGKNEPIMLARLVGLAKKLTIGLIEPKYQLPMVGRKEELALIGEIMVAVRSGQGQIVAITAEAGMGKSRLAAEVMNIGREQLLTILGGECQSYGTATSYLVWRGIWRCFFAIDPALSPEAQTESIKEQLSRLDPELLPRLPLLGAVLNLTIPDNDLTRSLDAKARKSSLEDLLVRCLQARARQEPLMLVLEDCHWLDDLSRDLVGVIGRALVDLPILMLLVYRPPDRMSESAMPVEELPCFTEISLKGFSAAETRQLVELKLANYFGEGAGVPNALLDRVTAQASGNPFCIEETLNYLQDLGIELQDAEALQAVDLPTSIHALVLSRIDQLSEDQQLTIKVASVIGRLFPAAVIWGIYPDRAPERVLHDLDVLSSLDLTLLDTPEPELTYLFKHITTQQVTYESLLFATRAMLHEQIGLYIERTHPNRLDQYTDLLAFHFEHSKNKAKKREYLLKAGEAAQKDYANGAAIIYFEKSLPLLADQELVDTRLKLGKALELTGSWEEAGDQYELALAEAEALADREAAAWCQTALGELWRKRNEYEKAAGWFTQAQATFERIDNKAGAGQVLHFAGTLAANQGDYVLANERYTESLALSRELGDRENEAQILNNLGIVARYLGESSVSRRYHEEALAIQEELGNRWTTGALLNNLGQQAIDSGNLAQARDQLHRALHIWREIGERWATTNTLHNLANVAREEGDIREAQRLYHDSITGWRALNDNWGIAYWLEDAALLRLRQDEPARALQLLSAAAELRESIGAPRPPSYKEKLDAELAPAFATLTETEQEELIASGKALSLDKAISTALEGAVL